MQTLRSMHKDILLTQYILHGMVYSLKYIEMRPDYAPLFILI